MLFVPCRAFKFITGTTVSTPRRSDENRGCAHKEIVRYASRNQWLSGPRSWIELEAGGKDRKSAELEEGGATEPTSYKTVSHLSP